MYSNYEALKKKKGVSDYEVSKRTGISTSTLSEWKSGQYTPKVDKMILLAKYFEVPLEELVETEEVKP